MRRKNPDFSYKDETREIIEAHHSPWELMYRDEREGFHRFLNRVVSLTHELEQEITYVENMFFPESIDLSEEWVMYRTEPAALPTNIYYCGTVVTENITQAPNIDSFISYYADILEHRKTISGLIPVIDSLTATNVTSAYALGNGYLWTLNLMEDTIVSSGIVDLDTPSTFDAFFDVNHQSFRITEEFLPSSLEVLNTSGNVVQYELLTSDDLTGIWNPEFDANGDGIIDEYEKNLLGQIYGKSMKELTPEEWGLADWADVNKDGKITETDYQSVMSSYRSASPDTQGIVRLAATEIGQYTISYIPKNSTISEIYSLDNGFEEIFTTTAIDAYASNISYDALTNVYYGVVQGTGGKELRAFTYDSELDKITGDNLIYVSYWNSSCYIVDTDIANGILYLLVTDGQTTKMLYDDIRGEYVDSIQEVADVSTNNLGRFVPDSLAVTEDGYVVIGEGTRLEMFKPLRDRYLEIDGVTYFNIRRDFTDDSGTPYITVPQYIFNNFDSLAYSFGIDRPWGVDNYSMRELIMDFYEHTQGNDKRGVCYGIMRELGYKNETIAVSDMTYTLPSKLSPSGNITVNGESAHVIEQTGSDFTLSGEFGTIQVEDGLSIAPSSEFVTGNSSVEITGYYYDGNNDPNLLTQTITIAKGSPSYPFLVTTMTDKIYLSGVGLWVSGEATSDLVSTIADAEEASPFIYKNARPDSTLVDAHRLAEKPLLPTIISPLVKTSGIVDVSNDVEIVA